MEQWEVADQQRHEAVTAAAADEGWTVVTRQRVKLLFTSLHESPGTGLNISPYGRSTPVILLTLLYIATFEPFVKFHDMQALQPI